jgi:hypothetical protein
MEYDIDDVDIGIVGIAVVAACGMIAYCVSAYLGVGNPGEIGTFAIAAGGMIGSLARGRISGGSE